MPPQPNLYGQRPPKRQKKEMSLSSSLDFSAQLTSLLSNPSSEKAGAPSTHDRPSRTKPDIFGAAKSKRRDAGLRGDQRPEGRLEIKPVAGTEEEKRQLDQARRKMEEKARLYAAMKRGDYVPKENEAAPLVDFDRKWAETDEGRRHDSSSSSADDDDDEDEEIIEYQDEFGRTRRGTKAEAERMARRAQRGQIGADEVERMAARPNAPSNIIYGDAIQTLAFNPEDTGKMEELARKRDRSATPPEATHYNADWEIRTKGVGFYKFSKDEGSRAREMQALEEERLKTDQERKDREEKREARRREIEERRREIEARRAKKQADNFLDGLAAEMSHKGA